MKNNVDKMDGNTIYKEVVVIGNGPSGIITSLMLSGRLPYLTTNEHPDEMLSARLKNLRSPCLITQDLEFLAQGLEGRCNNPVSLLMDALLHPYADLGLDLEPLVEFRPNGKEIDHVVLGRGPPGGSWHRIDPDVLTLSLGSWMALPGIPFPSCTTNEKRAFTRDVATYYQYYVEQMGLTKYFKNDILATAVIKINNDSSCLNKAVSEESLSRKKSIWVKKLDRDVVERVKDYFDPVCEEGSGNICFISNALNCLLSRNPRRTRHCKRPRSIYQENTSKRLHQNKSEPIIIPKHERKRSFSCCCCCDDNNDTGRNTPKTFLHSQSLDTFNNPVPFYQKLNSSTSSSCNVTTPKWIVQTTDVNTGQIIKYSCKYLVLACGTYDSPNRLEIFRNGCDPEWLVHDLRGLEKKLDKKLDDGEAVDPVLIVGAGLSAADAVMAVRSRNVPVVHVFRAKSAEFTKQLPENMYPEYHKVRQMMIDGGSTYPLYRAYPEYSLTEFDGQSQTVKLTAQSGEIIKLKLSFAAVLIGSRPNLAFLPQDLKLGVFPDREIDSKTNPVDVNPITHEVIGHEGLFAVGPLAADNFVRYIPGGAVAVVSDLYKKWGLVDC